MLKLAGGHIHRHSPTGIATKTPTRNMEEPPRLFEDMEASPTADGQQESGSHTFSEGTPPIDWGHEANQAEKRRKMNRESARRTRQRKQDQMTSLKAEVVALQTQNLCSTERLKAASEKNQELSADSQKMNEHNQLLIKCVGELSVVCKRKQTTLERLSRYIQVAGKVTDIPLPPLEQIEDQLSSECLQMLRVPQLSNPQPAACRPVSGSLPAPSDTTPAHLPPPAQMHCTGTAYMPSSDQCLMTPLHHTTPFSGTPMRMPLSTARTSGIMGLSRSASLGNLPHAPTAGSVRRPGANPFPGNSRPCNFAVLNPPITSGNPAAGAANQSRAPPTGLHQLINGHALGSSAAYGAPGHPHQGQAQSAGARQALLIEAAKQQDGFNPKQVSNIVRMTQQLPVQRASSDPLFFQLPPSNGAHSDTMQEILGRQVEWKCDDRQQRSLEPNLAHCHDTQQVSATHGLLQVEAGRHMESSAQDCSNQILDIPTTSFLQMPMQHLDEHMTGQHNYGMQ